MDFRETHGVRRVTSGKNFSCFSSNIARVSEKVPQQSNISRDCILKAPIVYKRHDDTSARVQHKRSNNFRNFASCKHENTEINRVCPRVVEPYNFNRYWLDHDFKHSFYFHEIVEKDGIHFDRTRHPLFETSSDENDIADVGVNESPLLYPWMKAQYGIYLFLYLFNTFCFCHRLTKSLQIIKLFNKSIKLDGFFYFFFYGRIRILQKFNFRSFKKKTQERI